ncbi:MAG: hypothetical protein CMD36_06255 [Flavobacteriales bacterium]|nr:hypothetical protein [Flavobacteriales bacterium]
MQIVIYNLFLIFLCFLFLISCAEKQENKNQQSEIVLLSKQISKEPKNIKLILDRVNYNLSKNNYESAIYDLKQCVLLDSLNADIRYKIGDAYFNLSKKSQKIEHINSSILHLEKAVKIDKKNYLSLSLLGEIFLAFRGVDEKKFIQSLSYFKRSLEINYNQEKTHLLIGYVYKYLQNIDMAIKFFSNAININPKFKEAYIEIAHTYHLQKDTLAISYYNNALLLDSFDVQLLYNKAIFYQEIMDWNNALSSYSELHKVDPFHADGHYNLGFIHMELKLFDIATNNFSDAIYSNPNYYQAYYSRGICFETLGNIAQAESDYNRAIEINPSYDFAIKALKNIKKNNEYTRTN